jgi:hypothetical protein
VAATLFNLTKENAMMTRVREFFQKQRPSSQTSHCRRLALESLEDRQVPTVSYHGGALISSVVVEPLFYGSDWVNVPSYHQQVRYLEDFLPRLVDSSYMDMLTNAGCRVYRGTTLPGQFLPDNIGGSTIGDISLRGTLQAEIYNGTLRNPNRYLLYVIYVQDNVEVTFSLGGRTFTSKKDFGGYHSAFAGFATDGSGADIHYAVIPYRGGAVGNLSYDFLSAQDQLTLVTSHEIAEAVTDPDVNYKKLGWFDSDPALGGAGEVGDIAAPSTVYLNGYAVQRIADTNDQPMTPRGALAHTGESFVLFNDGTLWEHPLGANGAAFHFVGGGIAAISDQGIDFHGEAFVDVLFPNGDAWEYHHGALGWVPLASGVQDAKASQGVSYLLFPGGAVWGFDERTATYRLTAGNATAIDAGTDQFGVNMVDVIDTATNAWSYSDTGARRLLATGIAQVSAGQQGVSDFVTVNGDAFWFLWGGWGNQTFQFASNVLSVKTGTDANGNYQIDMIINNFGITQAWEYTTLSGWTFVNNNVGYVSKARGGWVDVIDLLFNYYTHRNRDGVNSPVLAGNVFLAG